MTDKPPRTRRLTIGLILASIVALILSCLFISSTIAKSVLPPLPKSIAYIAKLTNNFESVETVNKTGDYMLGFLDTYIVVGDQMLLETEKGRYYIDVLTKFEHEIGGFLKDDPALLDEAAVSFMIFGPPLQALVEGQGDTVVVTEEMVAHVNWILDYLEENGSPELCEVIRTERELTPLEPLIGMTFEQARLYLVGPADSTPLELPGDE